ncbi:N/A [soil metagenome]|jgi:methoxymalonate biosynthesis acyl carrier protein
MEVLTRSSTIKEKIKDFISKSISVNDVDENEDLFDSGIVNSLFSIQLVTFVEKNFGINVTVDDLDMDNFKSVNAINKFVQYKLIG